jgi:hypothetical protein
MLGLIPLGGLGCEDLLSEVVSCLLDQLLVLVKVLIVDEKADVATGQAKEGRATALTSQ